MNPNFSDRKIKILHLEDMATDAELIARELKKDGMIFDLLWVDNRAGFILALENFLPDVILSDHSLPSFDSFDALKIVQERGVRVPFILITATTSEEVAVEVMKQGAWDYVLKDRLQRLPRAVMNALEKWQTEKEKQEYYDQLLLSEKRFRGLIENSYDMVGLVNENHTAIYRSPSTARITGFSDEERKKESGLDQTHPEDIEQYKKIIEQVHANPGKAFPVSFRTRHKDGHYIWIEGVITNMLEDEAIRGIITNFRDVTETRLAQQQAEESHKRILFHLENSPLGFIEWNSDQQIAIWSPTVQEIFGWTKEEYEQLKNNEQVFIDDITLVAKENERILSGKVNRNHVINRNYKKDGSVIWCEWFNSALRDDKGKVVTVMSLVRDITEIKTSEERLEASERRFRAMIENISDGIVLTDNDQNLLYQSPSVSKILGYSEEERLHKGIRAYVHPDYIEQYNELHNAARKDSEPHPFEFQFRHKKGTYIWLEGVIRNMLNDPAVGGVIANYRDVTHRKLVNEILKEYNDRYEILSKATNDVIWDWDIVTDKVLYSNSIYTVMGYENFDVRIEGKWWDEHVHPEDRDRIWLEMENIFSYQRPNWEFNYRFRIANGDYKYIHDRSYVVYDNAGKPVRMIGAMQDVTEVMEYRLDLEQKVKERTQELNEALHKEKELVDMKSRFVSIASHEFRTPLSTISLATGFIRKFKKKITPEEIDKKLETIQTQVHHMSSLLDDVLTVGKGDAGKIEVNLARLNVRRLLEELVQEVVNNTRRTHRVNFYLNCAYEYLQLDEGLMRNIIINLLTNAIKFSPESKEVDFSAVSHQQVLTIRIIDHGLGIPEEDLGSLFQPFFRSKSVAAISGTGLGLSIVKKAVILMKGDVQVKSKIGEGTEFIVTLPILV